MPHNSVHKSKIVEFPTFKTFHSALFSVKSRLLKVLLFKSRASEMYNTTGIAPDFNKCSVTLGSGILPSLEYSELNA